MTSQERHKQRYLRRKEQREEKKRVQCKDHDNFEWVFSYDHLYHSYKMCRRNVSWKASVQRYIVNAPLNIWATYEKLMAGKYRTSGFFEFDVFERGKKRHIRSVTIGERVVQRCLCDYALVPVLSRTFIYDNGASLSHKGYSFAVNRLCYHLQRHYRKYGNEGYILLFDFSKFFDRISHELIKRILREEFTDERIIGLTEHFVDAFGDIGMGLGSQISQVLALASANRLDHYIKEICQIHEYGRYMDDGYLIHPDKEYLLKCLESIKQLCDELGIVLNIKKTQIVKLSHGFTWLKIRFFLLDDGKVVKKIYKRSITKMRTKLKKFTTKLESGEMTLDDVKASWNSWKAYSKKFSAWHTAKNIEDLYTELFILGGENHVL